MKRLAWMSCLVLVTACPSTPDRPAEREPAPPPPTLSLADVAGAWMLHAMTIEGDSTIVMAELNATADTQGWTMSFPERERLPTRVVAVAGDSLVLETGPYPSAFREGISVTTTTVLHLEEGMLMGTFVAHYATSDPDSVLRGRIEGSRK